MLKKRTKFRKIKTREKKETQVKDIIKRFDISFKQTIKNNGNKAG